jgi:hypothetical protein
MHRSRVTPPDGVAQVPCRGRYLPPNREAGSFPYRGKEPGRIVFPAAQTISLLADYPLPAPVI